MTNYLEFACYPNAEETYSGDCILVLISLCAPIATYGLTNCTIEKSYQGHNNIRPEDVGKTPENFRSIEDGIKDILESNKILFLDSNFLNQQLPNDVVEQIEYAFGDRYIDAIFQ